MTTHAGASSTAVRRLDQKRIGRLAVGVVALALSIGYLVKALGMPQGTIESPGPGMFPAGVGVGAIIISLIVIIEGLVGAGTRGSMEFPVGFERRQVAIFTGTLVGFVLVLPLLGMYLSAVLYMVATLKFLGRLSWIRAGVVGTIIAIAVPWIFQTILRIPLPAGIW